MLLKKEISTPDKERCENVIRPKESIRLEPGGECFPPAEVYVSTIVTLWSEKGQEEGRNL